MSIHQLHAHCALTQRNLPREKKPENISLIFIFNIPVYPVSYENKQIRIRQLSLKHSRDCLSKDTRSLTEILQYDRNIIIKIQREPNSDTINGQLFNCSQSGV